ncbi:hypothetical protein RB200_04390 [Streptomyces sp. PmtG]
MQLRRPTRTGVVGLAVGAVLTGLLTTAVQAAADSGPRQPTDKPGTGQKARVAIPAGERAALLGQDWRTSGDTAWTTTSDANGFHLLTAREKEGYAWKTTASLSEPGFDADAWIGNACVTGSGKRAVVVYAPRTFTNKPQLMARGAFTAVVDLATGRVAKVPLRASLSYYNPGCGVGETAVLTQSGGEDKAATRLYRLDTATGALSKPVETRGQVTSSVVTKDGSVVAAAGAQIVKIDVRGGQRSLAHTDAVPYRLTPDADGGVVFLDRSRPVRATSKEGRVVAPGGGGTTDVKTTRVKRLSEGQITTPDARRAKARLLATGPLTATGVTRSGGTVYLTGEAKPLAGAELPPTVRDLARVPKDALVSTRGEALVTRTVWSDGQGALIRADDNGAARPVDVALTALDSGGKATFTVEPGDRPSAHIGEGGQRTGAQHGQGREARPVGGAPREP